MNWNAVGFVAILGIVGVGVDYHQQSQKAGLSLGQMGPGDYVGTIQARIDGVKAEKAAQLADSNRKKAWKAGGKPYLPEAPEGWTRRGFNEGSTLAIVPAMKKKDAMGDVAGGNYLAAARMTEAVPEGHSASGGGIASLMGQRSAADIATEVAGRSWVYERDGETVFVEVKTRRAPNLNSLAGSISKTMEMAVGGMDGIDRGWDVVGGVAYTESLNSNGKHPNHYRILKGVIGFGQEIHIRVHANASSASTREILAAIDYDGMNAMLRMPMAAVGNGMEPPAGVKRDELADKMLKLRREFDLLLAKEGQYRLRNLNAGALVFNTMARNYGAGDGMVDMTGGQAVSMEALIYAGFRQGMRELMQGGDGFAALGEVGGAFGTAVAQHQATTLDGASQEAAAVPVMSPGLAAELGEVTAADASAEQAVAEQAVASTQASAAEKSGGGFLGSISGLFGGSGGNSGEVASAVASRDKVQVRRLGSGGGTRIATGGCGAGQFCQASDE